MTVENCIKLLEAYKKQMENPVNSNGQPLHGNQRKHAIARSKVNYRNMAFRIINSKKFNGGTIFVRSRGGTGYPRKFEKHPIVDKLKKEFSLIENKSKTTEKPKEVKEDGKKSKR